MKFVILFALAFYASLSLVNSISSGATGDIAVLQFVTHHTFLWKFNGVKERKIRCSGALIAVNAIISTAKCLRQKDFTKVKVYLGTATFESGTALTPTKLFIKEDFDVSTLERNLGIMIIPEQSMGEHYQWLGVAYAYLATPGVPYNGSIATVAGFGRSDFSSEPSNTLQKAEHTIIWNTDCNINPYLPATPMPAKTPATVWDMCTKFPSTTEGDGCFGGDEGAGLVAVDPAVGASGDDPNILIGIFSHNAGAGNCLMADTSVYVRIAKVRTWIKNVQDMNPAFG